MPYLNKVLTSARAYGSGAVTLDGDEERKSKMARLLMEGLLQLATAKDGPGLTGSTYSILVA